MNFAKMSDRTLKILANLKKSDGVWDVNNSEITAGVNIAYRFSFRFAIITPAVGSELFQTIY